MEKKREYPIVLSPPYFCFHLWKRRQELETEKESFIQMPTNMHPGCLTTASFRHLQIRNHISSLSSSLTSIQRPLPLILRVSATVNAIKL